MPAPTRDITGTDSGVTRGLSQGGKLGEGPTNRYWSTWDNIGRNCYDVEKSEPVVFVRVPCAEFEVRNEGTIRTLLLFLSSFCFVLTAMTLALQTPSSKVTVTVMGVTTRGSGGGSPAAGGQRGWGAEPPTLRRFLKFFPKNKAFFCIFWSKFLLKSMFKWLKCVFDASWRPAPRTLV